MEINILVFNALDVIAKRHRISDVDWAEAAGIRRPTISELRRLRKTNVKGDKEMKLHRVCSLAKMIKLYTGLSIILGNGPLNEEFKKVINDETDQYMRLQMLILMLKNEKKEKQDQAEKMLRKVLGT